MSAKAKGPKLGARNPIQVFHVEWQGHRYVGHHLLYLLPPGVCIKRKLELRADLGLKPRHV